MYTVMQQGVGRLVVPGVVRPDHVLVPVNLLEPLGGREPVGRVRVVLVSVQTIVEANAGEGGRGRWRSVWGSFARSRMRPPRGEVAMPAAQCQCDGGCPPPET